MASGNPSVGASGSIFGLLAALIVYGRRSGGGMMTRQLWQWAIIMFAFGLFPGLRVNNWAHAGGFVAGWLLAQTMPTSDTREGRGVQILALALLVLTAAGFVLSFVNVTSILLSG
jgi:membrane associated rhomboid family serine protease